MGECDFTELEKYLDSLEQTENQLSSFMEGCAKELAARLLTKVVKRTPVGEYEKSTGKVGGTLRRGWTTGNSLTVKREGDSYVVDIINPIDYASYVEYGHRTRSGTGWVPGRFMMTISEQEIEKSAPGILERRIKKVMEEAFK